MRTALLLACLAGYAAASLPNLRPIIGILTLPNDNAPQVRGAGGVFIVVPLSFCCSWSSAQFPGLSYFPASYVKWMESAGARVVPIKVYLRRNGVFSSDGVLVSPVLPIVSGNYMTFVENMWFTTACAR